MSSSPKSAYKSKTRNELRALAQHILQKFPARRRNFAIDIEGIIEDFDLELIFRSMRGIPVEAYVARATQYIVVNQDYTYLHERYRFTLAEELAHRVLEFNLLAPQKPQKAPRRTEELTDTEYRAIERDAKSLAAEILQPENLYRERFAFHQTRLRNEGLTHPDTLLKETVRAIARDFRVSVRSAGYRSSVLRFITRRRFDLLFPLMF
ncbi:MAG: IrrE N-terminal-like domain [Verrucomicrobiota bacterium]|jgi:Zn-dependent peptidase ImmA (M78 family)